MILREVTVGRAPDSDILCGPECVYVSSRHAVIYMDGDRLMFKDISTNGTMINNIKVHHRAIPINIGDTILLASKFPLSWNQIGTFFPLSELRKPSTQVHNGTIINNETGYHDPIREQRIYENSSTDNRMYEVTSAWNWGAFFLYPLWGFANGTWWAFLIAVFFGWSIIPNIIFGICGSKWAWRNKQWRNLEHFTSVQDSWKKWGIGIFLGSIGLTILFCLMIASLGSL